MKENSVALSQNKFYSIYLIGFFFILFLPILAYPPLLHPASFAKSIVFRIIFSLLLFLFLGQILFRKDALRTILDRIPRGRSGLVFWLLIVLLAISILSTIFSADPNFSFWGSPYRGGGSLTYLFLILFSILIFLIVRQKDWQKLWFFSVIVGLLVSLLGIFQNFQLFSSFLIPATTKVSATLGGPTFLGLYLLLLIFPTLACGLAEKIRWKKIFYLSAVLIFIFVIVLTGSQAAYLGFGLGLIYFLLFYPKRLLIFKFFIAFLVILGLTSVIFGTHYLKTHPDSPLNKNFLIRNLFYWRIDDSRISAWKVSLNALKDRPLLGWGPENFSIPFDKHYDPSLSGIDRQPGGVVTGWWDRAHNILFEMSLTYGIPALIIYLSLFFVLFWRLQKIKTYPYKSVGISINQCNDKSAQISINQCLIAHGIQTAFLAYFADIFFSFDVFSTLLVSFFLIGWAMHLTKGRTEKEELQNYSQEIIPRKNLALLIITILVLCPLLVWFDWSYNLKPLFINSEINWAEWYSKNKKCSKAVEKMEKILPSKSILDNYLRLQYINFIKECMEEYPDQKPIFALKGIELLKEAINSRPTYTRTWLFLGTFHNIFVENSQNLEPEIKAQSLWAADSYFQKAYELNPKRQEIFVGWIKTDLLAKKYQEAKEKAQTCIDLNPKLPNCWWGKGLALLYLENYEGAAENMEIAAQKGYDINSKEALSQLLRAYLKIGEEGKDKSFYQKLADIYQKLIKYEPDNFQYHASLAYVYKTLGDYQKAAEEAIIVFLLSPESRIGIEEFLNSIPSVDNYYRVIAKNYETLITDSPKRPQYHLALAFLYKMMGEYQKAKEEATIVLELSPELRKNIEEFLKSLP